MERGTVVGQGADEAVAGSAGPATRSSRRLALGLAAADPWLVLIAAPLLLFPGWWTAGGIGLLALGWLGRWMASGRLSAPSSLGVPAAILALVVGIDVVVTPLPAVSRGPALGILLGLAVCCSLVNAPALWHRRALTTMTAIGVVVSLVGLLGTDWSIAPALAGGLPGAMDERLLGPALRGALADLARTLDVFNPREVGGSLALVLPPAVIRLWYGRHGAWRHPVPFAGGAIAASLMAVLLVLSQSVSAVAGVAIALWLSVVLADRKRRRWWLAAGLLLLALGAAATWPRMGGLALLRDTTAMPTQPSPGVAHAAFGVAARLEIWPRGVQMLRDMPYTGIGLGMFPQVMDRFYSGFILGPERHAHNFLLSAGVELGLPGLIAVAWLLIAFAAQLKGGALRSADPATYGTGLGLGAGVLAFLLFGTIDVVSLYAKPALAAWIAIGVGSGLTLNGQAPGASRGKERRRRLTALPAVMSAILALALLLPVRGGGPALNAGRLLAYRSLLSKSSAGDGRAALAAAQTYLEDAVRADPGRSRSWYLLGTVAAYSGEADAAVTALRRGVLADSVAPLRRYALGEALLAPDPGTDWPALQRVYAQWTTRYPGRAEWYASTAIAACEGEHDRQAALDQLARGRAAGAEPGDLLDAYHQHLIQGAVC